MRTACSTSNNASDQPHRIDTALVSDTFRAKIPIEFAREKLIIEQGQNDAGALILYMPHPLEGEKNKNRTVSYGFITHNTAVRLGRSVHIRYAPAEEIARALDALAAEQAERSRASEASTESTSRNLTSSDPEAQNVDAQDIEAILKADEQDLLQTAGRAPVVRLVNALLFEALSHRASDVHIQPSPGHVNDTAVAVRFRVDGALRDVRRLPRKLLAPIVSRVKVMGGMDIAERRLPQDGRALVRIGPSEVDLRISSLPIAGGERIVIRLLDKRNAGFFALSNLGMPPLIRARFEALCRRPHGVVLVTGPTGSGKTTTLYSALRTLNCSDRNIMTLEDPIEYELPGVSQSQMNAKKGVTFATGLRHVLRQDPDVIMVGEIRDAETARIAIQSSLTGHLVFSTLHTNSAAAAVARLADLGVEPYLINASLTAVLAQRLVRRLCVVCSGTGFVNGSENPTISGGLGDPQARCDACAASGFRGRIGIFELLEMREEIRDLVASGASASRLHHAARTSKCPMRTLHEAGMDAVSQRLTTREEVDRVAFADETTRDAVTKKAVS